MRVGTENKKRAYDLLFLLLSGGPVTQKISSTVSVKWQKEDWEALILIAFSQGVSGLFYYACEGRPELGWVPQWVSERLRKDYYVNFGRNMILSDELDRFCRLCDEKELPVLLMRGATFFQSIYPTVGVRPMIDLDLVVRQEDLSLCCEVLEALGYAPFPGYPFFYEKEDVYFDLHVDKAGFWKAPRWPTQLRIDDLDLWERTVSFQGHAYVRMMSLHDSLLSCCDHLQMHSFNRLIWFMDIIYLMRSEKPGFDWEGCLARAKEIGLDRSFCLVVEFLAANGVTDLPPNWLNIRPRLNWFEKKVRSKLLRNEREDLPGELISWLAIPGLSNKLKVVWDILSTRTTSLEGDKERIGLWGEKRIFRLIRQSFRKALKAVRKK